MTDCVFCEIIAGTSPASVVHADDDVVAFMDILPVNPGHILVIPRTHATYLEDLPPATVGPLMTVAHRIALAIHKSPLRADGLNLFLADGEAAGQEVFHVHLHVIPRLVGDGLSLLVDYDPAPPRAALDDHAATIADALTGAG
jgi:diadenosine tetraphosphate (Ap4A) HIT family hydrolase